MTVTRSSEQARDDDTRNSWAGTRQCSREWNRSATDAQLRELAFAALVDPVRRNRKGAAWVDRWTFGSGEVALIGRGMRGRTARVSRKQCLVAAGPDTGLVFVRFKRGWLQVSGDSPTEAAYPAVMMARAGGNSYIRRDGTVLPIIGN